VVVIAFAGFAQLIWPLMVMGISSANVEEEIENPETTASKRTRTRLGRRIFTKKL
jgi:hypothetical protein